MGPKTRVNQAFMYFEYVYDPWRVQIRVEYTSLHCHTSASGSTLHVLISNRLWT